MTPQRQAVLKWLNELGIRDPDNLDTGDYAQVRGILGNDRKAFGIFVSLMMFERQQAVMQLMMADLSNSAGAVRAAKLQGIVLCIDNMRELILNIADPPEAAVASAPREVAGVRFDGRPTEHEPVS